MPEPREPRFCPKHGWDCDPYDAFWLCDTCARKDIDPCKCGSPARYFGEAMMKSVRCESCDEGLMTICCDEDIRKQWNEGKRGLIEPPR